MLHKNGEITALLNFRSLLVLSFSLTAFLIFILPISELISSAVAGEKKNELGKLGNREWVNS